MYYRLLKSNHYLKYVLGLVIVVVLYFVFSRNDILATIDYSYIEHYDNDILLTPHKYDSQYLHEWVPAPVVPDVPGRPGELGKPVVLPESMEEVATKRFKEHEFNIVVSELISANRSLADNRDPLCLNLAYPSRLPTTSIIIIFHNEAWSTLIRSVWSIINRSPKGLVKEIILVDDASTLDFLGEKLDEYVKTLPVHTKVLRMGERFGLLRARLLGAENAQGEILTFLDAHIECNEGWLAPLLSSITENRRAVAIPTIDIIKDDTFEYDLANSELWGGFDWTLTFKWIPIPERERKRTANSTVASLHTPTMAGGLFSIDKEFFYEIGSYDEGMIIWGSENLEMSFRVWMCGGILKTIPCSRVGHVFRKHTPYTYPGEGVQHIIVHNCNRLVNVWLDDWIPIYYTLNADRKKIDAGDVSSRMDLRKQLHCKDFQWYVNNIYPEIDLPKDQHVGQIQNVKSQTCLDAHAENKETILYTCHRDSNIQMFVLTKLGEIRHHALCIDANAKDGSIKSLKCNQTEGNQKWEYDAERKTIKHNTGSCLQSHPTEREVIIKKCDGSKAQQWLLIEAIRESQIEL